MAPEAYPCCCELVAVVLRPMLEMVRLDIAKNWGTNLGDLGTLLGIQDPDSHW